MVSTYSEILVAPAKIFFQKLLTECKVYSNLDLNWKVDFQLYRKRLLLFHQQR